MSIAILINKGFVLFFYTFLCVCRSYLEEIGHRHKHISQKGEKRRETELKCMDVR